MLILKTFITFILFYSLKLRALQFYLKRTSVYAVVSYK